MSNPFVLGQITYEAETLWGEAVNTFATLQLPITAAVDTSGLTQAKIDSGRVGAYRNQGYQHILGPMGGSFKVRLALAGFGSSTAGAVSKSALHDFHGWALGNATLSASSGHTAGSGSTATSITTAATPPTYAPGSLVALGALGDGRCNGQLTVIGTQVTTTLTPLVAAAGSLSSGDAIRSGLNLYPYEAPTSTAMTSARFRLMTANLVYDCHGCFVMSAPVTGTEPGGVVTIEYTIGVSWFEEKASVTFPATTTRIDYQPGINAGGSLHVSDVGTATRNDRTNARGFTVDMGIGVEPRMGYGGANAAQVVVGAVRMPDNVTVSWVEDAPAQTASPALVTYATGTTFKQVLWTASTTDGRTIGFYAPYVAVTERPVQIQDGNRNALRFTGKCLTGPTTTSDLTLSAWRWFLG